MTELQATSIDLFEYDERSGSIKIANVNYLGLEPFQRILDNDKNNKTKLAFDIFLFLYLYCDLRSYLNAQGHNEQTRLSKAKELARLPSDWAITEDVQDAINMYVAIHDSLKREIYISTKRSLRSAARVIEKSRELLETLLTNDNMTPDDIKNSQVALDKILDFAAKLPDRVELLDRADELIKKDKAVLRGGGAKRKSHNPDNENR